MFYKRALERELGDEVRAHLEFATEENLRRGLTLEEARHAARREFGGVEQVKEIYRDRRGVPMLETLLQDARFGARMLRKSPGFTAVTVLTLALGIGANTAIFSVVSSVLLRPLPFKDPDRLAALMDYLPRQNENLVMDADYRAWSQQALSFESMAAYESGEFTLTGAGEPQRINSLRVTPQFLPVLGIAPILGRNFLPEESQAGGAHVVILTNSLWRERFGASPAAIGKSVDLDGNPYDIIGVLPAAFEFGKMKHDLLVPLAISEAGIQIRRSVMIVGVIARLRRGISFAHAQAELSAINTRLQAGYPVSFVRMMAGAQARVIPLHDHFVGNARPALFVLLGAVGFVLLIVCANVANLQLGRSIARQKEIAIRIAVGAGRWRLARQLLVESWLLASLGAVAGAALAYWSVAFLKTIGPSEIPHLASAHLDAKTLAFTAAIAVLTGLLFGLAPIVSVSRIDPNDTLKEAGARTGALGSRWKFQSFLVAAELALALVLLTGSGLLIRSFVRIVEIPPGFSARNVLTGYIELPLSAYREESRQREFFQQLLSRLRALPGVSSAAASGVLPMEGFNMMAGIEIEGQPAVPGGPPPSTAVTTISPGYFETVKIPLLSGRYISEADRPGAPFVAVANEAFVRRFFPNEGPFEHKVHVGGDQWYTIVGVVGNVRQMGLTKEISPELFISYLQQPTQVMAVLVHTRENPMPIAAAVRAQVHALDPDLPLDQVSTLERNLAEEVATPRFNMLVIGFFAALALALAVVGIYGVMSYAVSQSTHEIGVRMALGAQQGDILRLIGRRGLTLTLIGVTFGLGGSLLLTRYLSSLLFGVRATDALTFFAVCSLLLFVATLASWIPARRAARVNPLIALRYQ